MVRVVRTNVALPGKVFENLVVPSYFKRWDRNDFSCCGD